MAALLLNLCISGGITCSSVAQPLWIVAALALVSVNFGTQTEGSAVEARIAYQGHQDHRPKQPNSQPASETNYSVFGTRFSTLSRALPLPILAGLAIAYLMLVFSPLTRSATYMAAARSNYGEDSNVPGWRNKFEPHWREQMVALDGTNKEKATLTAMAYLKSYIIEPLRAAGREDPGDSVPPLELSYWLMEEWKLAALFEQW